MGYFVSFRARGSRLSSLDEMCSSKQMRKATKSLLPPSGFNTFVVSYQKSFGLDGHNFDVRIDFLLNHSFNRHQRPRQGTGTTAASSLITNAQRVVAYA